MNPILEAAQRLRDDLVALRRDLHAHPEIGLRLPRTRDVVLEELRGIDLEITQGSSLDSVVAVLRGGARRGPDAPVVLLRADMDALPVAELTGLDYAPADPGVMHACGHDLHVAGLVGAARLLDGMREELAGDVVLMFQPGEEGPGGAEPMIAEGLLDVAGRRVDAAYALHVFSSEQPHGMWFGRPGTLMAGSDEVAVRVIGAGGHGSAPFRAKDPIPVICEMVLAIQSRVTRGFDIFDPIVVTVGKIAGGTKDNIIPDDAHFEATVRSFSASARERAIEELTRVCSGIADGHGLRVEITHVPGYPATVNDPDEYAFAVDTITDLFGAERYVEMPHPEAGSEDFSYVLAQVPGAYVNLSAAQGPDFATAPDNHSPRAIFDDSVLPDAAALLAELARRRLAHFADDAGSLTAQ